MKTLALTAVIAITILSTQAVYAADLYAPGSWSAMASDRGPERVGDSLTVVIYENSTAVNSAQNGSRRNNHLAGSVRSGASSSQSISADLNGAFDAAAQTGRTGKLVAQISVTVDEIMPNGDLKVSGEQLLNINGERTRIKLKGRVRRADVTSENTVLSTRLADAAIDYDGAGFVTRSSGPGLVKTIFNWLGVP